VQWAYLPVAFIRRKSMKVALLCLVGGCLAAVASISHADDMTVDSAPPVVVKTIPEAGAKDVDPGLKEIKVTFSKKMHDHSWSWSTAWENSTPEVPKGAMPKYSDDKRTCVLPVKLEPGKVYGYWLNSENFHNFQDSHGQPAIPYLLVFKTKDASTAGK
jgi:hypothetical protein